MPAPTTETSHTTTQTTEPDKSAPTTETRQTTEPDMSAPTTETSQTTTRQTTEPNMSAPTTETSQTTRRQITEPDMSAPTTQTSPTTVMKATVTGTIRLYSYTFRQTTIEYNNTSNDREKIEIIISVIMSIVVLLIIIIATYKMYILKKNKYHRLARNGKIFEHVEMLDRIYRPTTTKL